MTEDELLLAVHEALAKQEDPDGYYTTEEWAEMFGYRDERAARKRIKQLIRAGRMVRGDVIRRAMAGTGEERSVPAYKFTEEEQ